MSKRLEAARRPAAGVAWAWRRLCETNGRVPIAELTQELGWSRKHLGARCRDEIGLPRRRTYRALLMLASGLIAFKKARHATLAHHQSG